jgi:hypothetical protein
MIKETIILKPKKIKTLGFLLISCLFVILAFSCLEEKSFIRWISIIFFGLGGIIFITQLLPGSTYLKLTQEGFEVKNLFRSNFTKWAEINAFRIGIVPIVIYWNDFFYWREWNKKMVMFDYKKTRKENFNSKDVFDSQGALPDSYDMSVEELVQLMN